MQRAAEGEGDPVLRRVGAALVVLAALLVVWAAWLGTALDPQAHRWHWVGLDVLEACGLLLTGILLLRRHRLRPALTAAGTIPLLWFDAAQDTVTSHASTVDLALALVMAFGVELPLSVALGWLVLRCLRCLRGGSVVA